MPTPTPNKLQCRHHPVCPGCGLLDAPYAAQLERKRKRLMNALERYPHLGLPAVSGIIGAVRTAGYRHRLKLPVFIGKDRVNIGLYDGAHRVLDTPDCPVLADPLREGLAAIREWLRGKRGVHSVDLRLSAATGELGAVFACHGGTFPGGAHGARGLRRAVPALASIAVSVADKDGKRVMGSSPTVIAGAATLSEQIGETQYRLHPGAFFQTDPLQAKVLHDIVRELAGTAATVLDLYAGVGAYGLMLAPGRKRVVLVEEVPQAAAGARAVAPRNVEVHAHKVEAHRFGERFDLAIVNPARRGSDPKTLQAVANAAHRLIYVSCGPEALARDLDILAAFGMRAERLVPIDLFPQTPEIETVVHLTRGGSLRTWQTETGQARSPWTEDAPSGAPGRPTEDVALVLGSVRPRANADGGQVRRIGTYAGHSLVEISLNGSLSRALGTLKAWGHPVAGHDPKTRAFFAERAGLLRPFVHVSKDRDGNVVPLHGDLAQALAVLSSSPSHPAPRAAPRTPRRR